MARSIVQTDGQIVFRTRTFSDAGKAARFAKCLQGNSRFTDVNIVDSARAKTPKCFITFRPSNPERQAELFTAQSDARLIRGYEQAHNYLFQADRDQMGLTFCLNIESGEVYELTCFGCSCPDYVYRCNRAGISCKHMAALQCQADNGMLEEQSAPAQVSPAIINEIENRRERCLAGREIDF